MFIILKFKMIQKIQKITRISARKSFKILREKWPIFCNALNTKIFVTNTYFDHIYGKSKVRQTEEIILRLLMINLIDDILEKWKIVEKRENDHFIYFEIQYKFKWEIFCLVISNIKKSWKFILFSSFLK